MLPTRNRILNLARRGTLKCTIGLPSQDPNQTMRVYQNIIQRISDPGILDLSWEHAGILIDTDDLTYYPTLKTQN